MEKEKVRAVNNHISSDFDDLYDIIFNRDQGIVIGITVSVIVVVFTMVLWLWCRKSSSKRSVLLVGLCDSGKTLIFSRLVHQRYFATQTSLTENVANYVVSGDKRKPPLQLVDLPGHERVRQMYVDKHKSALRGIICVVDGMTFQKDLKDVAELLYQLLTDRAITRNSPSILVACNKQDQPLAKGARLIQSALEKELNNVRKTRSAALEGTDGTVAASVYLGRRDQPFTFADLRPMTIEFIECNATGNDTDKFQIDGITKWLENVA